MYYSEEQIIDIVKDLKQEHHWKDPYTLADLMDITIKEVDFYDQKGIFIKLMDKKYIFLNTNLCPELKNIVLYHELGHNVLHIDDMPEIGFSDSDLFHKSSNRMEYEANLFAAELSLDDDEVLDMCVSNNDIYQIAKALDSDINLVALKVDLLRKKGHKLGKVEHKNDFLKK